MTLEELNERVARAQLAFDVAQAELEAAQARRNKAGKAMTVAVDAFNDAVERARAETRLSDRVTDQP